MMIPFNPPLILFLSYTAGVLLTEVLRRSRLYLYLHDLNFINDRQTKGIGVLWLGWLLRKSPLGMFNRNLKFKGYVRREQLSRLKKDMTYAEVNHLLGFILFSAFIIVLGFLGINWWQLLLYFLTNVFFNLYIVFLQQYNKRRINKLLKRC